VIDLFFAIIDGFAEKCGNLFSMGTTDGVSPQRPLWHNVLTILSVAAVIAAFIYFGIWLW
jgi:hypothetical protein